MGLDAVEASYFKRSSLWKFTVVLLAVILFVVIIVSLNVGYAQIPFEHILLILGKRVPGISSVIDSSVVPSVEEMIIMQIRLPRIFAGALVGAALAAAGVMYQGIFKNPMADSYVLGVSAGASVGASFAIVFGAGLTLVGMGAVQVAAFTGAILTVFLVYSISRVGPKVPVTTLLLSGIAVSIFLSAIVTILTVISGNKLHGIVFWLAGGFFNVEWVDVWAVVPFILLGILASYFFARDLNLLALGEETAQHLGVNTERVKQVLLVLGSLVTAAAVSISGLIGFVGLMIPHITRLLIGPDHRVLLPASTIIGAIFLVICDAVARVLTGAMELPVGVITALAGGPFFVYLLRKKKASYGM
jgi:iron complex transport system permease protein